MGKLRRIGTKGLRSGSLFSQPEPLLTERILSVTRRCSCRPEVNIVVRQHPRTPSSSVPVRLRSRGEQGHPPSPSPFNRRSVACPVSIKTFHLVRSRGGYPHRLVLLSGRSHSHYPHLAAAQWAGRLRQGLELPWLVAVGVEARVSCVVRAPSWSSKVWDSSQLAARIPRALTEPQSLIVQTRAHPDRCLSDDAQSGDDPPVTLSGWVPPAHKRAAGLAVVMALLC